MDTKTYISCRMIYSHQLKSEKRWEQIVYHRLGSTTFSDTVDSTVAELLKRERVYSSE